jgi:hypothetical protein
MKEAKNVKCQAAKYIMDGKILYKRSFIHPYYDVFQKPRHNMSCKRSVKLYV